MANIRLLALGSLGLSILLGAGCSPVREGTVEGRVTVQGKPAVGEHVTFFAAETGEGASAEVGADGTFRLSTPLRVGTFVVTVVTPSPPPMAGPPPKKSNMGIPDKYRREETSDLRATVVGGKNTFEFELKP
ncbi:MAG: carboxypeptidase-like regulatory domain-containing protein [Planctomycetes bacterium]|nr:carboxypeptidase-like regulatory domain-containing protein [Planctomycetota bacterium]